MIELKLVGRERIAERNSGTHYKGCDENHIVCAFLKERESFHALLKETEEGLPCIAWEDFVVVKKPTTCLMVLEASQKAGKDVEITLCANCKAKQALRRAIGKLEEAVK